MDAGTANAGLAGRVLVNAFQGVRDGEDARGSRTVIRRQALVMTVARGVVMAGLQQVSI